MNSRSLYFLPSTVRVAKPLSSPYEFFALQLYVPASALVKVFTTSEPLMAKIVNLPALDIWAPL